MKKKIALERLPDVSKKSLNKFNSSSYFAGLTEVSNNRAFLIISGGDVVNKLICCTSNIKQNRALVMDIDGVPHTVIRCRPRFIRTLVAGGQAVKCYSQLRQVLAENDIREFFYDLWRAYTNCMAVSRNITEFNMLRYSRKHGRKANVGKDINFHRHGMSMRCAASSYGAL